MLSSFRKVFQLLDAFTADAPEWSLADLSRETGIAKPTVHHIMTTLIEGGWIDRNAETKKYRLGVRLWEKGWLAVNQMGVRDVARPFLESLVVECGETVRLAIIDSVDPRWVIYIDRVEGQHAVRADVAGATRAPSYSVATGKAILAHNPDIVKSLLARPLKGYTPGTLTDSATLLRDLALTRQRGYSLNQSEFRSDVVGVAAPVLNHEGRVLAAVGVSGPAYRLGSAATKRIAPAVVATAREISKRMGYMHNNHGGSDENVASNRNRRTAAPGSRGNNGAKLSGTSDRGVRGLRSRGRQ